MSSPSGGGGRGGRPGPRWRAATGRLQGGGRDRRLHTAHHPTITYKSPTALGPCPALPCLPSLFTSCSDEPTSGLDSAAAYYVMAAVRRLAEKCRTIIRWGRPGEQRGRCGGGRCDNLRRC